MAAWPAEVRRRLRQPWTYRGRVVAVTESAERTLCHLDVWPANLVADARTSVLLEVVAAIVASGRVPHYRNRRELTPALIAGMTPLVAMMPGSRDLLPRMMAGLRRLVRGMNSRTDG